MTIGELSQQSGIPTRTIRYYEDLGLLEPSARSDGNYRLYSPEQVHRARIVHSLKKGGMSLKKIKNFLIVQEANNGQERGKKVTDILEDELLETERKIKKLLHHKGQLETALIISRECKNCKRPCDNCMKSRYTFESYPELLIYQFKEANKD